MMMGRQAWAMPLLRITWLAMSTSFAPFSRSTCSTTCEQPAPMIALKLDFPAKDLKEFLAYAKANPGKLNIGTPQIGTTQNLAAEMFKSTI